MQKEVILVLFRFTCCTFRDNETSAGLAYQRPGVLLEPDKGAGTLSPLYPGNRLYDGIDADFENAGLQVTNVFQVENHFLWKRYKREKEEFATTYTEIGE